MRPRSHAAFGIATALVLLAAPARSGRKECAQAYVDAQKYIKNGELHHAREQLLVCVKDECLAAVRKDCMTWLDHVNASIPTVVLEAKGPDGKDTVDVRLFVDGQLVSERLDVRAIELEPGTRRFRFEMAGHDPVEQDVILRQGEKNKVVAANFTTKLGQAETSQAPVRARLGRPPLGVLHYVFGGVALAAFGGAGIFWYRAEAGKSKLEEAGCSPNCSGDDVAGIKRERVIGDVLLGLGIVSAGALVYLVLAPEKADSKKAAWGEPIVRF